MRILKSDEHCLMPAPITVQGKSYWCIGVLNYFDFDKPDVLLPEQQLWQEVMPEFGSDIAMLDAGTLKIRGEFLAAGHCYAPRGETRDASRVTIRVGNISKSIDVFGNRYWVKTAGAITTVTKPEPFSAMPIDWKHAFGGPDYPHNIYGKGITPVLLDEQLVTPLPNLELTGKLIASPSDKPLPASFGVVDPSWFPRRNKLGTCDEHWKDNVWPGLPLDCNLEFFNFASEDQMFSGFFTGDETFEILNMHPDHPRLSGSLPPFRQRIILHRLNITTGETNYHELETKIDTVWLFPGIKKGIVIHRATTEAFFEDNRDILTLHVATEHRDSAPQPLEQIIKTPDEHYAEKVDMPKELEIYGLNELKKPNMFEDNFKEKLLLLQASAQRRTIKSSILAMLPAPEMVLPPRESHAAILNTLNKQIAEFEKLREQAAAVIMESPQHVNFELTTIDENLDRVKYEKAKLERPSLINKLPNTEFDEETLDIPRKGPWHDYMFRFTIAAKRTLSHTPELSQKLQQYGFLENDIDIRWFGFNQTPRLCSYAKVGLRMPATKESFTIPAGLVIPHFDRTTLTAVHILSGWPELPLHTCTMVALPGSQQEPRHFKATIPGSPIIWVNNDFEAHLVDVLCGEFYESITIPSCNQMLSKSASASVRNAPNCFILRPDNASNDEIAHLFPLHPNTRIESLPKGASISECIEKSGNLRELLLSLLSVETMDLGNTEKLKHLSNDATQYLAPELVRDASPTRIPEQIAAIKAETREHALANPLSAKIKKDVFSELENAIGATNLNDSIPLTLSEARILIKEQKVVKGRTLVQLDLSGMDFTGTSFENTTIQDCNLSNTIFKDCSFNFSCCINSDFANANFSNANFTMVSFVECTMPNTTFAHTKHSQCSFTKCVFNHARFSHAEIALSSFMECQLFQADFSHASLTLGAIASSDANESNWQECSLDSVHASEVQLEKANFSHSSFLNTSFSDIHSPHSNFSHTTIENGHFMTAEKGTNLEQANFAHSNMTGSSFQQVYLYKADLTATKFNKSLMNATYAMGAEMPLLVAKETRFIESGLDGSNMQYANLLGSAFTRTRLSGVNLSYANMYAADLRNSILGETNFDHTNLKLTVIEGKGHLFKNKPAHNDRDNS